MKRVLVTLASLTCLACGEGGALDANQGLSPGEKREALENGCYGGCFYDGDRGSWLACDNPCDEDDEERETASVH